MNTSLSAIIRSLPLALLLLTGCAAGRSPAGSGAPTPKWNLSGEARNIFLHLKADALLRGKDKAMAVPVLEELVSEVPTPDGFRDLAALYWERGDLALARQTLKKGMSRFPDSPELVLLLAKTYLAEKRPDDAVVTIQEYLSDHPEDWSMYENLGALLIDAREYAAALDNLERIPDEARSARALFLLGKAGAEVGLTDKAVTFLRRAVQADPDFFQARVELAYVYERRKEYAEAEAIYAELLQEGEQSPQLLARLIELNLKLNNPDKALQIASLAPDSDTDFRLEAVQQFLDHRFYDQGLRLLGPVLNRAPVPARARFQLALLSYEGDGDTERALQALAGISDEDPLFEQALLLRIHLTAQSGSPDRALDLAEAGIAAFPEQFRFRLLRADLLDRRKETGRAVAELEEALTAWPGNTEILFRLGVLEDRLGKRDQALGRMEEIIRTDPDHADALNYLGYSLAEQGEQLDRALVLIRNALRLEPDNIYFRDSLAWVLFRRGQVEAAWEEIVRTVAAAPDDPTIWEHYGDIARAMNKPAEARKGYEEALKRKPGDAELQKKLKEVLRVKF